MGTPQFHLYLPQMRMSMETLVEKAAAAEDCGFEGMALMDHLAPPRAESHDMWESMTCAAWLLAHTRRLKLGHLVLCDSLRHPAVLARQAVTLDHASRGRFELGIGWGSVPSELTTFGVGSTDAGYRVARLEETLHLLLALWSGDPVDYDGQHFKLSGAQQRPIPTDHIPLTIGGIGPRTLQLVAKYADWWNLPVYGLEKLEELRPRTGSARVSTQHMVTFIADESERSVLTETAQRRFGGSAMGKSMLVGNAAELTDKFAALHERGIERFYVWFSDFAAVPTIAKFGQQVIGSFTTSTSNSD